MPCSGLASIGDRYASPYVFVPALVLTSIVNYISGTLCTFKHLFTYFLTWQSVQTLPTLDNRCQESLLLSAVIEETLPFEARLSIMAAEAYTNSSMGLSRVLQPLGIHAALMALPLPLVARILLHYLVDTAIVTMDLYDSYIDSDLSRIGWHGHHQEEDISLVHPMTTSTPVLEEGCVIDTPEGRQLITPDMIVGDGVEKVQLKAGRVTIQSRTELPGIALPEYSVFRESTKHVGTNVGVKFATKGRSSGAETLAGILTRIAPDRIARTRPLIRWWEAYIAGEMPSHNPRYEHLELLREALLSEGYSEDEVPDILEQMYLASEGEGKSSVSENIHQHYRTLRTYERNNFRDLAQKFMIEGLKYNVEPKKLKDLIKDKPSRVKKKYIVENEFRGLTDEDFDCPAVMHPSDPVFELLGQNARMTNVFVKDEKYTPKPQVGADGILTPEYIDMCQKQGWFPLAVHKDKAEEFLGYKPRIISAESLGVRTEDTPGGQFLLLFYGTSVKNIIRDVLDRDYEIEHEITMKKEIVRFKFVTDTKAKSVTDTLREAYADAVERRVISVLIHGDDSLVLYPLITGDIGYVECDYSAFDTCQADDAILAEHDIYKYYCTDMADCLIERSLEMHKYPFTFTMGREYEYDRDFITVIVLMKEMMRHSGAWNTTTGNSLVGALIKLYVLTTMGFEGIRPLFNTYSDLRVNVKQSAYKFSTNPQDVTFLKMAIVETPAGLTFSVLPSRVLRISAMLTLFPNQDREDVRSIMQQTLHGYQVAPDYPILGPLAHRLYYRNVPALIQRFGEYITELITTGSTEILTPDELIHQDLTQKLGLRGGNGYDFALRYGGSYDVTADQVLSMMVRRYNTDILEIADFGKALSMVDGRTPYWIHHPLAKKMAKADYGVECYSDLE